MTSPFHRAAPAAALLLLLLAACANPDNAPRAEVDPDNPLNVIDQSDLNALMLTVSDPDDAVAYFRDSLDREPERVDLKRGYALALARARRYAEAADVFTELDGAGQMTDETRLEFAHTLARLQRWDEASAQMALVSPALETPRRYLIVAMLADQEGEWGKADKAYEKARQLSSNPASILNNWGVSRMSRGEYEAAQKLFEEALAYDPHLFNAKNNLAVSRALQGEYRLPLVSLTDEERAKLLHNVGVIALRRGDREQAKGLFRMAVEAHPRYYAAAAEKLAALEAQVVN